MSITRFSSCSTKPHLLIESDGSQGLAQAVEINSPLKLVILMLGTNDFQCVHENNAWTSAQGTAKLINIIRQAPIEPGMPMPEIMVVAPRAEVQAFFIV